VDASTRFNQLLIATLLAGCASNYEVDRVPNYDHLIGTQFSKLPSARGFTQVSDSAGVRELEDRRSDGCTTVFGVRRADDVITHWRVIPSPEQCLVRREALNR
jgi:hypothetical protein